MKNYYEELEVSKNASAEVINRAYKVLAKKYHPDSTTENKQFAEERFKTISEAYEVLSNEQKRAEYDKTLQPEIDSNRYYKILEDNKKLSQELLTLKSQLDNIKSNKTTYTSTTRTNNINTPPPNYNYNVNSNYNQPNYNPNTNYYQQPNYNTNTNYYQPRQKTYKQKYSLLDELKFNLKELGRKVLAIILTILVMAIAFGILYLLPPTRKFLIYDLQLGSLFSLFR